MSVFKYFEAIHRIDRQQRLMLESLILPSPGNSVSFKQWMAEADLRAMDFQTLRLVPALYDTFLRNGSPSAKGVTMKGVYRYFDYRNSLLAATGRRVVERMINSGIDLVLFKGIALALRYYGKLVLRPMTDFDVLVRRAALPSAEEILSDFGYRYLYDPQKKESDLHAHDYVHLNLSCFDLHWSAVYESPQSGVDAGIWDRVEFFDWNGLVVKLMSPEDLLLTTILNGVRTPGSVSLQWIHDVSIIVKSEPKIRWEVLWGEAKARGLRKQVFEALVFMDSLGIRAVPDGLLDFFLEYDRDFYRHLVAETILEGRGDCLDLARDGEMLSMFGSTCGSTVEGDASELSVQARKGRAAQHIRCLEGPAGLLEGVCLQWRHLRYVWELFSVSETNTLRSLADACPNVGAGMFPIPQGLLSTVPRPVLPDYRARMAIDPCLNRVSLAPQAVFRVAVEVENTSSCCWHVCGGSASSFGLSYHVFSLQGRLVQWDAPRSEILSARHGYVVFIEPTQRVSVELDIVAPLKPGSYRIQFDIVHEHVAWFSEKGNDFPSIVLTVSGEAPVGRYQIRTGVTHETIDDETSIVELHTGAYFTVEGHASVIWNFLVAGCPVQDILSAYSEASIEGWRSEWVEDFIESLEKERLIQPMEGEMRMLTAPVRIDGRFASIPPVLARHPGLHELTARHPVTGISPTSGWPHVNSEAQG